MFPEFIGRPYLFEKFNVPVSAKAMWNNLQEYGALEVEVSLF